MLGRGGSGVCSEGRRIRAGSDCQEHGGTQGATSISDVPTDHLVWSWLHTSVVRRKSARVGAPAFRQNDATESERIVVTFIGRAHVSPLSYLGGVPHPCTSWHLVRQKARHDDRVRENLRAPRVNEVSTPAPGSPLHRTASHDERARRPSSRVAALRRDVGIAFPCRRSPPGARSGPG